MGRHLVVDSQYNDDCNERCEAERYGEALQSPCIIDGSPSSRFRGRWLLAFESIMINSRNE